MDTERILVVDDEENVALTVAEVLRREGYTVEVALTGQEAVARLQKEQYDLVLTDLHMEGVDGLSVLSEVRRHQPLTIAIVLTGFASLESAVASMRQGAYDYLIKPCIIEDLKLTIRRGIEHRRLLLAERESRRKLEDVNATLERRVQEQTRNLLRANEDLKRHAAAKDVFLAMVSHELRTPLTPIIGWARLLGQNPNNSALVQGLKVIERNAIQQAKIVEDLLDVSRIITGKLAIEAKELNLNSAVVAAVETMRDTTAQKKIQVDLDVPAGRVLVRGDESRLVQVFCNLLSNANKFTDPGGRIKVSVSENEQEATVTVTDTGCGIPSNFLPHVFDSFQQGEWFQTRKHEGLGLGLSIVRSLVELHDGRVGVQSNGVGQGSAFSVHIPLLRGKHAATLQRAASASGNAAEDGPGTILIVNDAADTNELLRIVFESHGWRVFTAGAVGEALTLFGQIQPSIVITDIGLPDESGFNLRTRLTEQGHASTPVIALSGYTRPEDIERARSLGFADYLSIPLDMQNLVSTVERLAIGRAATASGTKFIPHSKAAR